MQDGMRFTRRQVLAGTCAAMIWSPGRARAAAERALFCIDRSKNANRVQYDLELRADGELNADHPLKAYWLMLAEDGRHEELSWLERRMAYGWSLTRSAGRDGFDLRLIACSRRVLRVRRDAAGRYRAAVDIARRDAWLGRLFVKTSDGGIAPSVEYVDLFGIDRVSGRAVSERLRA